MMPLRNSIQHRLVLYVSLCLLAVSLLSGGISYRLAFDHELDNAISLEQQLVNTVQAQAEVAVYASNTTIAEGVIEGLLANPGILAVRIVGKSSRHFQVGAAPDAAGYVTSTTEYPLYSPVDGTEPIGSITIVRNETTIRSGATRNALYQTSLLLLHIVVTALLIILFSRHLVGKPVAQLAATLASIKPGSGSRVHVPAKHANTEIGSLADSANALIQAAEEALAEIEALATTDALTGLLNRRAFMAELANEQARLQRHELRQTCVLMLDLDNFKLINDHHGHAAGDTVLQQFGSLLRNELRKIDRAGRIGGEEFAILLPETHPQAAFAFAERLRSLVESAAIPYAGSDLGITVSIGISRLDPADAEAGIALRRADHALYRAKREGRNRVLIDY
jgi:diguanylate cyclase (GGDEF)-like protein